MLLKITNMTTCLGVPQWYVRAECCFRCQFFSSALHNILLTGRSLRLGP